MLLAIILQGDGSISNYISLVYLNYVLRCYLKPQKLKLA
uniref:Uncharacterized protein n=1 Tax=Anguilla anguilla TaxID=7936 RepID=A0A0E9VWB9_ANGAN